MTRRYLPESVSGVKYIIPISWDDIQRLKAEAGYGDRWAVEVYPDDAEVINVANMRHIWLLDDAPACSWRRQRSAEVA